jgi:hypothetical protein
LLLSLSWIREIFSFFLPFFCALLACCCTFRIHYWRISSIVICRSAILWFPTVQSRFYATVLDFVQFQRTSSASLSSCLLFYLFFFLSVQ